MNTYIKGKISKGEFVSELFKQRVESIGGTYEANDCLVNSLNSLTDREFKDAKLILTPNGYVVDKLPTIKPNGGGDATVTRNTTKTRVNSSGLIESMANNVLAPDYLNGICPALNVEGQDTNRLQYSEQFDNAYWTRARVILSPGATTSPKGDLSAEEMTEDTIDTTHYVRHQLPVNLGDVISIFAKKNTKTKIGIALNISKKETRAIFNIENGTIEEGISVDAKIKDYGNGWFRCSIKALIDPSDIVDYFLVNETNNNIVYQGDGSSSLYLWGAEVKTTISSYIPTTTAAVTRSADDVTVPIPAGTTEIIEKYEDGTTNTITTIPTSPYTVPVGRYEYILMK